MRMWKKLQLVITLSLTAPCWRYAYIWPLIRFCVHKHTCEDQHICSTRAENAHDIEYVRVCVCVCVYLFMCGTFRCLCVKLKGCLQLGELLPGREDSGALMVRQTSKLDILRKLHACQDVCIAMSVLVCVFLCAGCIKDFQKSFMLSCRIFVVRCLNM